MHIERRRDLTRELFFFYSTVILILMFLVIINPNQNCWLCSSIRGRNRSPIPLKVHISATNNVNDLSIRELDRLNFRLGKNGVFFFTVVMNESVEAGRDVLKCIVSKSERNVGQPSHQSPLNLYKMNNEFQFCTFFSLLVNFFLSRNFLFFLASLPLFNAC